MCISLIVCLTICGKNYKAKTKLREEPDSEEIARLELEKKQEEERLSNIMKEDVCLDISHEILDRAVEQVY